MKTAQSQESALQVVGPPASDPQVAPGSTDTLEGAAQLGDASRDQQHAGSAAVLTIRWRSVMGATGAALAIGASVVGFRTYGPSNPQAPANQVEVNVDQNNSPRTRLEQRGGSNRANGGDATGKGDSSKGATRPYGGPLTGGEPNDSNGSDPRDTGDDPGPRTAPNGGTDDGGSNDPEARTDGTPTRKTVPDDRPVAPVGEPSRLRPGERMSASQRLVSDNGQYVLQLQRDGNLVVLAPGNRAVWATGTAISEPLLHNQSDGNVVLIAQGNNPVWDTKTDRQPGTELVMRSDGNLVAVNGGRILWQTGTP